MSGTAWTRLNRRYVYLETSLWISCQPQTVASHLVAVPFNLSGRWKMMWSPMPDFFSWDNVSFFFFSPPKMSSNYSLSNTHCCKIWLCGCWIEWSKMGYWLNWHMFVPSLLVLSSTNYRLFLESPVQLPWIYIYIYTCTLFLHHLILLFSLIFVDFAVSILWCTKEF